jgi:hypothetical protein
MKPSLRRENHQNMKTRVQTAAPGDALSRDRLDELWAAAKKAKSLLREDVIEHALSGDDPTAAKAYLYWLEKSVSEGSRPSAGVKAFAVEAFRRYHANDGKTLGQAFGLERAKPGNPPIRAGAMSAIISLIRFLHDEAGFKLSESASAPSAFEVASQLLARHWNWHRSASTLQEHWKKANVKRGN